MADNEELIYLAGLFDGEGTIGVYLLGARKRNGGYSARLAVDCMAGWPVDIPLRLFGGYVDARANKQGTSMVRWRLSGQADVERALLALLPYLRVKREQALLCLRFLEVRKVKSGRSKQNTPMFDESEFREQERLSLELKQAKRSVRDKASSDAIGR